MKRCRFKKTISAIILICLFQTGYGNNNSPFFNVKDFGAKGDDLTMNTEAIQNAINQCSSKGGGTVLFPSGTYLSGTIELFDNITLHLEAGAVLKGSANLSDYRNIGRTSEERNTSLIYAIGASNIAITGRGVIHGNDSAYTNWDKIQVECCYDPVYTRQGNAFANLSEGVAEYKRERPGILITFIECRNILLSGFTIKSAPNWSVVLACCDVANIVAVNVQNNLLVSNSDAVDVGNSKNVNISDCVIVAGDDGIVIGGLCTEGFCLSEAENINVSNCTITSRSSAIRIGWGMKGVRNCTFQNLIIHSNRGIGIFARHDEVVENLLFNNIIIHTRIYSGYWGIGEPVHISQIPLGTWYGASQDLSEYGKVRNIRFTNMEITSENSILLYGYNEHSIQNIEFQNVRHYFKNSRLNGVRGGNFELRPVFDNKYALFKHDIPAFYAKNVKGLSISNYSVERDGGLPDFCTNAIFCEDFSDLRITGFRGSSLNQNREYPVIYLENGEGAAITGCTATGNYKKLLKHKNVKIIDN